MARHVQIPLGIKPGQTIVYDPVTDSMVPADVPTLNVPPLGLMSDTGDTLVDDVIGDWLLPDTEGDTSTLLGALLVSNTGDLLLSDTSDDWLYGG